LLLKDVFDVKCLFVFADGKVPLMEQVGLLISYSDHVDERHPFSAQLIQMQL
jgi:hypothetical protein